MPVVLLRPPVSKETVQALEELLEQARTGHIRGLAYVAFEPRGEYTADVTGLAADNLTLTRGALLMLGNKLADVAFQKTK
jgi:hypothetical protein